MASHTTEVYDSLLGTVAFSGSGDFVNADNLNSGLMNLIGCTLALLHFICSLRCGSFMIAGSLVRQSVYFFLRNPYVICALLL